MKEAHVNTEWKNSLKAYGAWAYKIADMPHFTGMKTRFDVEKPCDIVGGYKGIFFGIEGKMIKKYESFGLKNMRPSQIKNLNEMVTKGNRAFVFLNIRILPDQTRGIRRMNRLLIFDWAKWSSIWERSGTLKKKHLESAKGIDGKNGLFDLRGFLSGLERANKRA